MKKTLITAGLLAFAIPSFAQATGNPPPPDKVLVYKTTKEAELNLHVFNPPGFLPERKVPAIVFFHGGGWKSGGPSQFFYQCRYLADRGMVAISASYRLTGSHKTTPVECVKDGKSAVRWIRTHAAGLGIDPDRLAAGGGSAGGHIAAATALVEGFNEDGEDLSVSCKPNALVLFNPVIDNGPGGFGNGLVSGYWKAFSPLHNISTGKHPPPALFLLGTKDKLIPVATGEKFKAGMEEAGARCDLVLYEGQPHSFFNIENESCHKETLAEMGRFLASLGFLTETNK